MMKKTFSVLIAAIALFMMAPPLSALAWAPERFYETSDELPQEVNAYLSTRLLDGEAMLTAHKNGGYLPLLTKTAQEERRLFIFEETGNGFACVFESGVLPEYHGMKPGVFSGAASVSLKYGDDNSFSFSRFGGRWLLCYVYAEDEFTIQAFSCVRSHHLGDGSLTRFPAYGKYTGERNLADIKEADLPASYADALSKLDTKDIAVVSNPDPKDRLHLRTKPQRDSVSLGKFYTGTPVEVLERKGDWCRVRLGRLEGWMMREYLAEGRDREQIRPAFLNWYPRDGVSVITRYTRPDKSSPVIPGEAWGSQLNDIIIGVAEEDWLILMSDAGDVCYVLRDTYWPGNG